MHIANYQKKPVIVQAVVWPGGAKHAADIVKWITKNGGEARHEEALRGITEHLVMRTLEGLITARPGDVIIRGTAGEFYPCKPGIFLAVYDRVAE